MYENITSGLHTGWSASSSEPYIRTLLAHRSKSEIFLGNQGVQSTPKTNISCLTEWKVPKQCLMSDCVQEFHMTHRHGAEWRCRMVQSQRCPCASSAAQSAPSAAHALNHSLQRSQSLNPFVWTCETQYEQGWCVFPAQTGSQHVHGFSAQSSFNQVLSN